MANETIKLGIQAELQNYKDIIKYITDGIEKGLVDGLSDKVVAKLQQQLKRATAEFGADSFGDALATLQRLGEMLLRAEEQINLAAGGAQEELAELERRLRKLKEERKSLRTDIANPNNRYREVDGGYVRSKSGVNRETVGIASDADWKHGTAKFGDIQVNYGGDKWSAQSAVRSIVGTLNERFKVLAPEVIEAMTKAIEEFGYSLKKEVTENGTVFSANRTVYTKDDYAKEQAAWTKREQKLQADIDTTELQIKDAEANVQHIRITSEEGEFVTPFDSTIQANKNISDLTQDLEDAEEQRSKFLKQATDESERMRDAQDALAKSTNQSTDSIKQQTGAVGKAVTTFFGYQMVLRQLRRLWREAITTITELDKQLTTQAMVTGMTREETWQLVESYQEIAQATGLAQTTIAGVTTEYLRQGETLQNALTLTKAAAAAATVAGISASDSVQYLTTAIHGFKLEAEDALAVSDKFAALAATAATNYEDLAVALSKVASQAALAGMSMDYTLALLTTGLDVTQEAPESIGTALKTVIARMREISDYGKTLEDDVDINQVESGLRAVNIALKDGTGELRSTEEVLDELGRKWSTLSANQQAAVAKALAGTRQQSRLVAIMENYDKVLDYQNTAMTSIGATTAQQVTYLEGMEAAVNNLRSTYQSLIKSLISSQEAINVVNMLRDVLEWVGSFLKQPAGRWALLSVVVNVLTRSKELMDRIKTTVDQLIASISRVRQEEQKVLDIRDKELIAEKQLLAAKQSRHALTSGSIRPNGWLSNNPTKSTGADVLSTFGKLLKSLVQVGPGWRARIGEQGRNFGTAFSSWQQNNSLVGKIRGAIADRKTIKQARENKPEYLIEAEQKLAKARQEAAAATKAASEVDRDYAEATGEGNGVFEREEQAKKRVLTLQQQEEEAAKRAAQRQQVLSSSQISAAEKMDYLARDELITKKEALLQNQNQTEEERKKTQEEIKQLKLEQQQTQTKSTGGTTGAKLSRVMSKVSGYVAAASTAISMIQEWGDIFQNYSKELGAQALEESKRIQSQMYQNTQLKSTIASTATTISKLSKQVVKTTEDLKALDEAQTEFAEAVNLSKEEIKAMTPEQIDNLSQAKQLALDEKNAELARELNDTLTKASYNRNGWEIAGNILGKTAAGAGVGAVTGTGWGALIGAIAGLVVGAGEEITRAAIAADAKNKINALLETDEGVEQFKYALKLNYKDIAQATEKGGKEMAAAMSAMFSSVVELFDVDDLKSILEQFNYDMVAFAQYFNEVLGKNMDAVQILSSDESTISQRVKAAQQIDKATAADEEINSAFRKINYNYLQIGDSLTDTNLAIVDAAKWSLSSVSAVVNAFNGDTEGLNNTFKQLDTWLQSGAQDSDELAEMIAKLSSEETKAIQDMITGGKQLQDVADINTRNRSQVTSFRETQAKWMSMSESDQQRFINDNLEFFADPEAARKFFNGEDIYNELKKYQADIQAESLKMYEEQRQSLLTQLAKAEADGNEALVKTTKALLNVVDKRIDSVEHMFDLTWEDVVNKEQQQIAKIKEMYQAEEEALTESLNKRKEAYQRYFDQLESMESAQDYAGKRDQLISSISSLAGGTDATSRNQVNNLRKQLQQAEEEEAKRRRQEAREAVIQNIDDQVTQISEKFNELLSNNKALLDTLDASIEAQYFMWLANSGATEAEQELARQQLGDLLQGKWGTNGLERFTNPEVTPPSVTDVQVDKTNNTFNLDINGGSHSISMNQDQMNRLLSRILDAVQEITGQRISMGGR